MIAIFDNRKDAMDNTVKKHKNIYRPDFYEEKQQYVVLF